MSGETYRVHNQPSDQQLGASPSPIFARILWRPLMPMENQGIRQQVTQTHTAPKILCKIDREVTPHRMRRPHLSDENVSSAAPSAWLPGTVAMSSNDPAAQSRSPRTGHGRSNG